MPWGPGWVSRTGGPPNLRQQEGSALVPDGTPADARTELCRYPLGKPEAWHLGCLPVIRGISGSRMPPARAQVQAHKQGAGQGTEEEREENSFLGSSTARPVDSGFLLGRGAPPSLKNKEQPWGSAPDVLGPTTHKSSSGAQPRRPVSSPLLLLPGRVDTR